MNFCQKKSSVRSREKVFFSPKSSKLQEEGWQISDIKNLQTNSLTVCNSDEAIFFSHRDLKNVSIMLILLLR